MAEGEEEKGEYKINLYLLVLKKEGGHSGLMLLQLHYAAVNTCMY